MIQYSSVRHIHSRNDESVTAMADKGDVNIGWSISYVRDPVEPLSDNLEIILQH